MGERRLVSDILLAMIFDILASGTLPRDMSPFLNLLSYYLDAEWDESSNETEEKSEISRTGARHERHLISVKGCAILVFLLQIKPAVPSILESFAHCCGSVEGAAGWILCAMVNSFDDTIRSLGVRCMVAYIEKTATSPDAPLATGTTLEPENTSSAPPEGAGARRIQSILAVGKGLAGMGPGVRSVVVTPSGLTARVAYKLLWHLLRGHRARIGKHTYAALVHLVVDNTNKTSSLSSKGFIRENLISSNDRVIGGFRINMDFANQMLLGRSIVSGCSLRDGLGISTVLRLLRYLSTDMREKLLCELLALVERDTSSIIALSGLPDWQPCLFQLISEAMERLGRQNKISVTIDGSTRDPPSSEVEVGISLNLLESASTVEKRADLCLDLYATLLGHCVRGGGDKVW